MILIGLLGVSALAGALPRELQTDFPDDIVAASETAWKSWAQPWIRMSGGNFQPKYLYGDRESGQLSVRLGLHASARHDAFIAEIRARTGLNALSAETTGVAAADQWKVGIETTSFHFRIGQIARWNGPGQFGSLIWTHSAQAPLGADIGGTLHLPGQLGNLSAQIGMGMLEAPRNDIRTPGWLLMELRWNPHDVFQIGWVRTSIYGGWENGKLRPIDPFQLLLPTQPHVEDDPLQLLPDTDEMAAWDVRLRLPLEQWLGGPVDRLDLYLQHGGEDVIARRLGPLPYPTLAGVANLYGGTLALGKLYANAELAVLEDDLFRWYTGHRIYHDGWTQKGQSLGHTWGGDQRDIIVSGSWVEAERYRFGLAYEKVVRFEVADRIESTVFILPNLEERHYAHLQGVFGFRNHRSLDVQATLGRVTNRDFVPADTIFEHRLAVHYSGPIHQFKSRSVNSEGPTGK